MKYRIPLLFTIVVFLLLTGACTAEQPKDSMADKPTKEAITSASADMSMASKSTEEAMTSASADMSMADKSAETAMESSSAETMGKPAEGVLMESPAWFGASLTDVNTGKTFTIADFKGKVVLVETMAQWCPNCKKQQTEVKTLLEKTGMPADLVTIALDIDPNENGDTLKSYAADNGFTWVYAVATADVSREIGNLYGAQFLNPTSTPILIVDRKGEAHPLPFGIKSADDLMAAIEPFLKAM